MKRLLITFGLLACFLFNGLPSLAQAGTPLESGDIITASRSTNQIFVVKPTGEVRAIPVSVGFKPAGLAYSQVTGDIIVAAFTQVLIIKPLTGEVKQISGFSAANDVAVDAAGNIVVSDRGASIDNKIKDGAIYRIRSNGTGKVRLAGGFPLVNPTCVEMDNQDRIVIADQDSADYGYDRIYILDPFTISITQVPDPDGYGLFVEHVVVDKDGNYWIAWLSYAIKLNPETGVEQDICRSTFNYSTGIAVDSNGNLIVSDGNEYNHPLLNSLTKVSDPRTSPVCRFSVIAYGDKVPGATGIAIVP